MMVTTVSTGGRPRSFDEDEVLDRALEVFWRLGHTNTTTRVLEAELGMTQSSIYNAFGSKRDLLERALDRYLCRLEVDVVQPLDQPGSATPDLLRFVDDLVAWISNDARPGCMMLNLLAEQGQSDPALVQRAKVYRDRLRQVFSAALVCSGAADAQLQAELMVASVMGINIAARGGAADEEIQALADGLRRQITDWSTQ